MNTSQNQNVFSTFLQPKNASVRLLIVGLFTYRNARFPYSFIYSSTSEITTLLYTVLPRFTPHCYGRQFALSLGEKKALTFSLNSTHLIRTLSMAPLVFGINGVWLYLKPDKDTPFGRSLPGSRAVYTHSFTLKPSLKQSGALIAKKEFQERLI